MKKILLLFFFIIFFSSCSVISNSGISIVPTVDIEKTVHWMVDDAGLIILHPFLPTLFDCLGLLDEERQFVGLEAQEKAVHLLRWMAGFDAPHRDYQLALEKMLCGLPLAYPIEPFFELSDEEIDQGRQVLESVCQNWPPLKGCLSGKAAGDYLGIER